MSTASPCQNICVLDPVTGWCIGCGRTGGEIAGWMTMSDPDKAVVNAGLPARLKTMTSRSVRQGVRHARQTAR
jgi:uncharacterized protein